MERQVVLQRRIRWLLLFVIANLLFWGITAFPLESVVGFLTRLLGVPGSASPEAYTGLLRWLTTVRDGLQQTGARYPFMAYGTDWLAYAHIILAILFLGPLRDPVRNVWVVTVGLIACVLVLPVALICGPIRGIPFFWSLIDCSFGIVGFGVLWPVRRFILELDAIQSDLSRRTLRT